MCSHIGEEFHGPLAMIVHGLLQPPFWLAMAGVATAWYVYLYRPGIADSIAKSFSGIHKLLLNKYFADKFNEIVFAGGGRGIGKAFFKGGDTFLIDGVLVNGSARLVGAFAMIARRMQTGYLYHYAFAMILGVLGLLSWLMLR